MVKSVRRTMKYAAPLGLMLDEFDTPIETIFRDIEGVNCGAGDRVVRPLLTGSKRLWGYSTIFSISCRRDEQCS